MNITNIFFIIIFLIPIICGITGRWSANSIKSSLAGLLSGVTELVSLIFSIIITREVFFEQNNANIFRLIYSAFPKQLISIMGGNDILTYIISIPIIYLILLILLRIITIPIKIFNEKFLTGLLIKSLKNKFFLYFLSILRGIPKAIVYVLISVVLLNFYTYKYPESAVSANIKDSEIYQYLYDNTLVPFLNSSLAKQLPVIINDSFKKAFEDNFSNYNNDNSGENPAYNLGNKAGVIYYFNGVTLDEAIKSNAEIDKTAQNITSKYTSTKSKANKIYSWISGNLEYDEEKVKKISANAKGTSSGSIEAFTTGKGICFDYSCLFVSMCRASGLKVRLVTGAGYSGTAWGDHAWNQVYCPEEDRWINVDTTFGTVGNYFDKRNFNADHRFGEIQGEW